jgi:hypothetical protein
VPDEFDERLNEAAARLKADADRVAEPAPDEPPTERLDAAIEGLDRARTDVSDARRALAEIESRLDEITVRRLPT